MHYLAFILGWYNRNSMQNKEQAIISCNMLAGLVTVPCIFLFIPYCLHPILEIYTNSTFSISVVTDTIFSACSILVGCIFCAGIFFAIRSALTFAIVKKRMHEAIVGNRCLPKNFIRVLVVVATMSFVFFWILGWRSIRPYGDWPRGFPDPDGFLIWLERTIDHARPAGPGRIKIEGEWPIIRYSIGLGNLISLSMMIGGMLLLNWSRLVRCIWKIQNSRKEALATKCKSQSF